MRLNMTILADELSCFGISDSRVGDPYELPLTGANLWSGKGSPNEQTVYVASANALPQLCAGKTLSLVCAGHLPEEYRTSPRVSYLELAYDIDLTLVLNAVLESFARLSDWNVRLGTACLSRKPLNEIAHIAWEPFENNFCCYDAQNYLLFFEHKPDDPYVQYYPDQYSYLSEEGRDELVGNTDYQQVFSSRLPIVMHDASQSTDSLVHNLFDGDTVIARLTIDETQRPFRPSDYTLVWYVGQFLHEVLTQWNLLRVGTSLAFDAMIDDLVERGTPFSAEHEQVLADANWALDDVYRCMTIVPREGAFDEANVSQSALFVQRHLENTFTSGNARRLLVVVNAGRRRDLPAPDQELMSFLEANGYLCGISREFRGFDRVRTFFKQSWETLRAGRSRGDDGPVFSFDEYALDLMLANASGSFSPDDYVIPQLHALVSYDREHVSELVQTLVTFIKGSMNVTATVNHLHVHKTTFYYRLRRIKEISGLSLDDYETVLYLMIVFETVEEFRSLSFA